MMLLTRMSNIPVEKKEDEPVKKIMKRSSPSGNLESYLGEVKYFEDDETTTQREDVIETESTTVKQLNDMLKFETSTSSIPLPTLLLDPFVGPREDATIPVFLIQEDEVSTTTSTNFVTTQATDATTPSTPAVTTDETSTEKFTTDQSVESDLMTSTISEEKFSTTESATTTEALKLIKASNDEEPEKLIATTTTESADVNTNFPQSRELYHFTIPDALSLSAIPVKPAIISASPETVRATPSELSSILTALRDILAKVESIAMSTLQGEKSASAKVQVNRKKRSIIEQTEEVKQKFINIKGCTFEGNFFKVGEKIISVDDQCLECSCEYAPIGHCVVKQECLL